MEINPETLEIEIVSIEPIDGGVQIFARAWSGGVQIGFGTDGTVDIERFRIFNPPVLVDDPNGDIVNEQISLDGIISYRPLREDAEQALLDTLSQVIKFVGKQNNLIVPGSVGNTTSTFYSSAGAVSPVDGYSGIDNSTVWATTRNAATGTSASNTANPVELRNYYGNGYGATYFTVFRSFHLFDTSAIPDADNISSATFSIYGTAKYAVGGNESLHLVSSTPASNSSITTADYDQTGSTSFGDTGATYNAAGFNDVTLNSSGLSHISKTTITKFGLRGYYDFNDIAPDATHDFQLNYYMADQTGTTNDPKLVVEHAAAASTFTPRVMVY